MLSQIPDFKGYISTCEFLIFQVIFYILKLSLLFIKVRVLIIHCM